MSVITCEDFPRKRLTDIHMAVASSERADWDINDVFNDSTKERGHKRLTGTVT